MKLIFYTRKSFFSGTQCGNMRNLLWPKIFRQINSIVMKLLSRNFCQKNSWKWISVISTMCGSTLIKKISSNQWPKLKSIIALFGITHDFTKNFLVACLQWNPRETNFHQHSILHLYCQKHLFIFSFNNVANLSFDFFYIQLISKFKLE